MKKALIIAMVCSICLATSACSGQNTEPTETASSTIQNVTEKAVEATTKIEKPTDESTGKPTEEPTEASTVIETEPEKHEYTAVELADKSLSEIIEIMGGDFDVDNGQKYLIHYTSPPASNIYNNDSLPGFVFFVKPKEGVAYDELADDTDFDGVKADVLAEKLEIAFIGLFDNAKYDENISVGMNYLDISEAMGSYELTPPVGSETMRQNIQYTDKETPSATVYYHSTGNDEDKARQRNPESWGIVVFPEK